METGEIVKLVASGGFTFALLYAAITLWNAFQKQVTDRIQFLEEQVKVLRSEQDGKAKIVE